jgi:hypothetical protein
MSKKDSSSGREWRSRWLPLLLVFVLLIGGAIVYASGMKSRGGTPKPVNEPTAAREVRPLSEKPDKRFAPLPIEREKHQK